MSIYLTSMTDEEFCKRLLDDELVTINTIKEAARRIRLYGHLLSYKPIEEHLRDAEMVEKLKDMKHGLLSIS